MKLFSLTSDLHTEVTQSVRKEAFIQAIEAQLGQAFTVESDPSKYNSSDSLIYVRTGGTEDIFVKRFEKHVSADFDIAGGIAAVKLLTSGHSNSLAASMEILSYLRMKGLKGEILHGSAAQIAARLQGEAHLSMESIHRPFASSPYKGMLSGHRYGVVGKPSDWLISSTVDYAKAKEVLGCELVDIPMEELVELVGKGPYSKPLGLKFPNEPRYGKSISEKSFQKAIDIYGALKRIINKYELDGLTLRCFDLLTSVNNTGCLALAHLNSEGYIATCEGDVPTMLSMALGREIYGHSGFQVNLSKIDGERLLFAHCTVPLDMVTGYCYDTHFESGIGVGIHGELPESVKGHILKIGADLESYIHERVYIHKNQYENNLCRTQIWVDQESPLASYMQTMPLGNHHVIFI